MKYIGNYKDWIKTSWVEELLENQGVAAPRDLWLKEGKHDEDYVSESKGYPLDSVTHYVFREEDVSFREELTNTLPYVSDGDLNWWFTKYFPGQFLPVHRDLNGMIGIDNPNIERYWMPFTEYEVGHIYLYEHSIIAPYEVGDLYLMPDPSARHGAVNLGSTIRIILNIGVYKG
jgi:hypothetical protein